jgi:serine/threonine-protein kinase
MSESRPTRPSADRNLLFGILALQMDFIDRDQLVSAMNAWVLAKDKSLGQVLVEVCALRPDQQAALEALVNLHVERHEGDIERSLAALAVSTPLRQELDSVADGEVHASLSRLTPRDVDAPSPLLSTVAQSRPPGAGLRYLTLRPHGKGGIGEVFVALDQELNREVALKEIQSQHAQDDHSRGRFVREAEITGGLEHPGIVPVYGLGQYADGRPYYAMRLIQGETLREAIARFHRTSGGVNRRRADGGDQPRRSSAFELRALLTRFIAVCNTIAYAHSRGVIHRDIKPSNIMLGKYGETLLVDWGLAKALGSDRPREESTTPPEPTLVPHLSDGSAETQVGSALGTPAYMSPEQAAGRVDLLGPASDIYSLGATLYTMLTGRAPIEDREVATVLRRVQQGDWLPPRQVKRDVHPALDAICRKAMALRPEDRYPTALALAADVEHRLADEPVAAYREPWTSRARRWGRRHRALVAGIAAALVVAAAGLTAATVLLSLSNRRERNLKEIAERREEEAKEQRDNARANKEIAERREKEAKEQRDKARANFKLAIDAVNDYCTKVGQDVRLKEQDLTSLRRQLLETAVHFYRQFVTEHGDDPELRAELARAYGRLAMLHSDLDEDKEAVALAQQAVDGFKALVAVNPDNPAYKHELATSYADLANCHMTNRDACLAADEQARQLWEELTKSYPDDRDYALGLARAYGNIGETVRLQGHWDDADGWIRRAIGVLEPLRQRFPKDEKVLKGLAADYRNLANTCRQRKKWQDGIDAGRKALKLWQVVADANPKDPYYRKHIGITWQILALLYEYLPDLDKAGEAFCQALEIHKGLGETFPTIGSYQYDLGNTYANLASFLDRIGKPEQATETLKEALSVNEKAANRYPKVPFYQTHVAHTLNDLGAHHARAGRETDMADAWTKAMTFLERVECTEPEEVAVHTLMATNWTLVAQARAGKGNFEGAVQACRHAAVLREKLAKRAKAPPADAFQLVVVYRQLAFYLERAKKPNDALACLDTGLRALKNVPQENDRQRQAIRQTALAIFQSQAHLLGQLKQHAKAIAIWDNALANCADNERTFLRLQRALAIVHSGDYRRAGKEAESLAGTSPLPGPILYDLACAFALCCAAVERDTKLPMTEREKLAEGHASRAMEMLTNAKAAGLFKNPNQVANLKTDADLNALRKRRDFKDFLAEVAPPGAPKDK